MTPEVRIADRHLAASSPASGVLHSLRPALAAAAQKVYDEWDETDTDTYAEGGICHLIADAMSDVISHHGFEDVASVSAATGEQHVFCIVAANDGVFEVDIPPHVYERGGGYHWTKVPDVHISSGHVIVSRIDPDPGNFGDYLD